MLTLNFPQMHSKHDTDPPPVTIVTVRLRPCCPAHASPHAERRRCQTINKHCFWATAGTCSGAEGEAVSESILH